MIICIVGNGKLAASLREGLAADPGTPGRLVDWAALEAAAAAGTGGPVVLVHTGSGRQLAACLDFCNRSGAVLMELATGEAPEPGRVACPYIMCPNTALPVLRFMQFLKASGRDFAGCRISIAESHQQSKTTVAGTAVELADALGLDRQLVRSVRQPAEQLALGIPPAHLDLHAWHRITIEDAGCEVRLELKVLGHAAYVAGVRHLLGRLADRQLEPGLHHVTDLV